MPRFDVPDMLRLAKKIHERRVIPSCLTCEHFVEANELCIKYKQRPPARVIAYGCPSWDDNIQIRAVTGDL